VNDDHARAARGALFFIAAGLLLFNVLPFGGEGKVRQDRTEIGFQELSETGPEEVCEYWVETDGPLYVRLRHNFSCTFTGYTTFLPATEIAINSKGFRGPPIANESPDDTERIFMLGDSFTFGWGVNRTDSYPYVFEQLLDNRSDQQYQVINAGVPGYGMRDYYEMVDHRVSRYDPDHIIVTFTWTDALDKRTYDRFLRDARDEVPEDASDREQRVQELFTERREAYFQRQETELWGGNASIVYYMDRIVERAEESNSSVTFYAYMDVRSAYMGRLQAWSNSTGVPVIPAPDRFDQLRTEQYSLSTADQHYNARGNRILAQTLFERFPEAQDDG